MPKPYVIHADGASRKDGRGGWGATILQGKDRHDIYGGAYNTTNNRMELRAAIEALEYLPDDSEVTMYCDSQYVVKGISEHIESWKFRRWRTSANAPIKNRDLWERLEVQNNRHRVVWLWVRGHNGDEGNEHADYLAGLGIPEKRTP
jgi:ribonuclease HI